MERFMRVVSVVLLVLSLLGCAKVFSEVVAGKPFKYQNISQIKKEKTTKQEVLELLGEPLNVRTHPSGEEIWYYFVEERGRSTNATHSLYVFLRRTGVVADIQQSRRP